jgi:hypothetical protein
VAAAEITGSEHREKETAMRHLYTIYVLQSPPQISVHGPKEIVTYKNLTAEDLSRITVIATIEANARSGLILPTGDAIFTYQFFNGLPTPIRTLLLSLQSRSDVSRE